MEWKVSGNTLQSDIGTCITEGNVLKEYHPKEGQVYAEIPDGICEIGFNAFKDCEKLENIKICESVVHIGPCAFMNCKSLKNIEIPEGVTEIFFKTFLGCESLERVTLPNSLREIDVLAFAGCKNLADINISENVFRIEAMAFWDTKWLNSKKDKYIIVGNGVLIQYNGRDKHIILPDTVKYLSGNAFSHKYRIKSVILPKNLKYLGKSCFEGFSAIEKMTFIGKFTEIGKRAFVGTHIKKIVFSEGDITIDEHALQDVFVMMFKTAEVEIDGNKVDRKVLRACYKELPYRSTEQFNSLKVLGVILRDISVKDLFIHKGKWVENAIFEEYLNLLDRGERLKDIEEEWYEQYFIQNFEEIYKKADALKKKKIVKMIEKSKSLKQDDIKKLLSIEKFDVEFRCLLLDQMRKRGFIGSVEFDL